MNARLMMMHIVQTSERKLCEQLSIASWVLRLEKKTANGTKSFFNPLMQG
jgi:hypothetical protein